MAFIQVHKHEARVPALQPFALFLWMYVVYELVFKYSEHYNALYSYSLAALVSVVTHIGIPPRKLLIFLDFIQLEWSLQYLLLIILHLPYPHSPGSYYHKLAVWPALLYTAVSMVMQLSSDQLKDRGLNNPILEVSKLVRQLRWLIELPTILRLYYEICLTYPIFSIEIVPWSMITYVFYLLITIDYCLYEGMQEACGKM